MSEPSRHTDGKSPNDGATEYIRNDAEAMRAAGWVPAVSLLDQRATEAENADLRAQLATARNDALEDAAQSLMPDTMEISEMATILRRKAAKIRAMKETDK